MTRLKAYVKALFEGKSTTELENGFTFINTFTGTGSSSGNDLPSALKFAFNSLISPLIENIDPDLNPEVTYKVKTIIEVTISLTVKLQDPNGDNAFIIIPFTFPASSNGLSNHKQVEYGVAYPVGSTSQSALTSTSASILAELGVLNLVLQKLIPQLSYELTGVGSGALGYSYDDASKFCSYYGSCDDYYDGL